MSNLLLKAAQHAISTARAKRAESVVVPCEKSSLKGRTYFLGNNIQVKTRKLPFVYAALIVVTDNQKGVHVSATVAYPEAYLDVGYAYSDKVFDDKIQDMIKELKAV